MDRAAAVMLENFAVSLAYQEGLYTPERHLFYLAMETLIYAQWKREGMLDARAVPFYPPIDTVYYMEKNNGETKSYKESKKSNKGIKKDDTTTKHKNVNKAPKFITEINTIIEDEWITVKNNNIKTRVARESTQKADRQNGKN